MATLLAGKDATTEADAAAVTGAGRVGAELRAARLRLGWLLPDIANSLRIRLAYLEAIEDGRVADLPGSAYAVGFVRTYAASLGLDADEVARRFRTEALEVNRKPELAFPAPVPQRGVPAGAVILVGAVIAGLAYAAWFRFTDDRGSQSRAEAVPPVPAHLAPLAGPAAPQSTPSPQVASIMPDKFVPPSASPPAAALAAQAPAPPASAPSAAGPAPAPAPSVPPAPVSSSPLAQPQPSPAASAVPGPPASAPAAAAPTAPVPAGTRILVQASAETWVQVRQRGGRILLNRVLRQGETWPVPDEPNLVLTTGNAGGTELLVDGQPTASLGKPGAVRRDVALDPAALAAQPSPASAPQPTGQPASTPLPRAQ